MIKKKISSRDVALKYGFRSGLELNVERQIQENKFDPHYETHTIQFIQPQKRRKYTPDFLLSPLPTTPDVKLLQKHIESGLVIVIESKGRFEAADRQKHLMLQEQYPSMDLRFIFTNSKGKITKNSKTTYAMWCEKYGFKYADKDIPQEWFEEVANKRKRNKK